MKCDDCLNLLEEYVDGELVERDAEQVNAHLTTCIRCATELEALTAENEIYSRYDREIEVSAGMWNAIAARTNDLTVARARREESARGSWLAGLFTLPRLGFALPAMAAVIFAVLMGFMFLGKHQPMPNQQIAKGPQPAAGVKPPDASEPSKPSVVQVSKSDQPVIEAAVHKAASTNRVIKHSNLSDVIPDVQADIEDKETAEHVEQAQNLLRSIKNFEPSDDEEEVDVSYEKGMSRRLLDENVVLRRDAEMAGNYPAKKMLSDLEPLLIDIANLPAKTTPADLRVIKDRVQKTEMVAALQSY